MDGFFFIVGLARFNMYTKFDFFKNLLLTKTCKAMQKCKTGWFGVLTQS